MPARVAYGNVELSYQTAAGPPAVFTKIANVKSINGPNVQMSFIETTDFDSSGGFRDFQPGLRDPGQIQVTLNYDPAVATHVLFDTNIDAGTTQTFRVRYGPSGTGAGGRTFTFTAYVESLNPAAEVDGVLEQSVTLRITGPITRATL